MYLDLVDSGTTYTDAAVTAGTLYRYTVSAYYSVSDTTSDQSDVVEETATTPPPPALPAPTGLTATAGASGIVLNWTAPDQTTDTVGGYNVNRCAEADCTPAYHDWVNGDSVTTYTDAAVTAGTLYRYSVSAYYDVSETTSDQSNVVEETATTTPPPPPPPALPAPTGLTATAGAGGNVLSWTAPDQTTDTVGGYNVNRCAGADCTPAYHDWVASGTTYTDAAVTAGTLYRYSVSAYYDVSETTSDQSNVVEETATGGTGPGIPTNFRASAGADGVVLRWSRPASGSVDGYNIYRCVGAGCDPVWFGNPDPATASSYTDRAVTADTTYRYAVNVYLNDRTTGNWSEVIEVTATVTPQAPPPKPAGPADLRARGGDRMLILSWDDPNDKNISLYQYRKKAAGGEYGNWTDISGSGASTTTYTATGLKNDTAYTFMMRALNAQGNVSESYEVTATPGTNALGVPEDLTATPISNGIVLRWSRPSSGPVDGYNIYRCAGAGCDPIWFANPDPATASSYTDRAVTADTTYRYAVAVYLNDRTLGDWSEVVTATATETSASDGTETVVPSDLTATAGAGGIVLNWTAPTTTSDTVEGHNVNRCEGADCTPVYHDWVPFRNDLHRRRRHGWRTLSLFGQRLLQCQRYDE